MVKLFDEFSTADEVLAGYDLNGMRVLLTGASSGIGVETVRVLAQHGAYVVAAARDLDKARSAISGVLDDDVPKGTIRFVELDLASLASVRALADSLVSEGKPFNLVIANAGVMACPFGKTEDGFETQFGTNHLGHFVLVNRIAGLLKPGSRVVILSSAGHRNGDVDLGDPNFERGGYEPWLAYSRSKTANALFAVGFDRRHKGRNIRAVAVHPGGVTTGLSRHVGQMTIRANIDAMNDKLAAEGKPIYRSKTVEQGAATTVWTGIVASAEEVGGRYCENCHVTTNISEEPLPAIGEGVRSYALDLQRADALWILSEQLVGETY
jgi:NAD(P)-dependent dehydrogenase (short-subunit alcohol dehydrogenase family)